ncbi:hypothetical protein LCGC14_2159890 [marine sediment metagenome]|uniref:Uncharacterized protein n=1 Tax=marine sediment metagenome TaxID=412755 RepID=A0A0F9G5Z5_9ZZZZ
MAAINDCPGLTHPLHPIAGFEQLTVTNAAVRTLTVPQDAVMAIVNVQDKAIYSRDEGTNPTTTVGRLKKADTEFSVCGSAMGTIGFIASGDDAKINVSYYGNPK